MTVVKASAVSPVSVFGMSRASSPFSVFGRMRKAFQADKATMAFQKTDQHAQGHRLMKEPAVWHERLYSNRNVHSCGFFQAGSMAFPSSELQNLKQQLLNYRCLKKSVQLMKEGINAFYILKEIKHANFI